jgi:hypothetical protein
MAKTRHYHKRARINNKLTRKHKGGVGSSPKQTIVNVPESAKNNIMVGIDGREYTVSKRNLEKWLKQNERGHGPTVR